MKHLLVAGLLAAPSWRSSPPSAPRKSPTTPTPTAPPSSGATRSSPSTCTPSCAGQDGNLFFSPYSISTALAMTRAGAKGDTAAQMDKTLHFTLARTN